MIVKVHFYEVKMNVFIEKFGYDIKVKLEFEGIEYIGRRVIKKDNVKLKIKFLTLTIYYLKLNTLG